MKDIKVSIVIPAYNCQNTIKSCICSALNQTLTDIEVIVVDDGSTDNTKKACEEFISDSRFRYYYKENAGVSAARNTGIKHAKGEYVGFVDSDDTISEDMYAKMYSQCQSNNAEICVCDINRCKSNGQISKYTDENVEGGVYNRADIEKHLMKKCLGYVDNSGNIVRIDWCVLRRLFNRKFLADNNILFDETLSNSEDCLFVYNATICAKTIVYLKNEFFYNNIISNVSLTKKYLPTYWEQRCRIIDKIYEIAKDINFTLDEDMMKLFVYRCVRASYYNIAYGFKTNSGIYSYKEFKKIITHKYVRQAMEIIPNANYDFEWNRLLQWTKNKKIFTLYSYHKDIFEKSKIHHKLRKITKRIFK